jgi:uncharacterized protein (DUF983 family)
MSMEATGPEVSERHAGKAIRNGARFKCPKCGVGSLYCGYLKSVDACAHCGEELHHHRADDAPPYFTILIVGHIIMAGILLVEKTFKPDLWTHAAIWLPLTIVLSLAILPVAKGALIGLQWALRMHGFDPNFVDEFDLTSPND